MIGAFAARPFSDSGLQIRVNVDLALDLSAAFDFVIYVASMAGYATQPTDRLPSQPFRGVLQRYEFQRSIMQGDFGVFTTGSGSLTISNADAYYDFLPIGYTIDARPINLNIGRADESYDKAYPLARLTSTGWNIDTDSIAIDLIDYSYKLNVPMQAGVYAGTGGREGGADIAGKRKPRVFGAAREIPAVALGAASSLVYQVNDGPVQAILNVYDRGAALSLAGDYPTYAALAAATIVSGSVATCRTEGFFRLGSVPDGIVTADVRGDNADGYVETTADIVRWAVRNCTSLADPQDLDVASFARLNEIQPAPVAYWLGPDDTLTVAAFIANVMAGVGGWGGHNRAGRFEVRRFEAAASTPVMRFTRRDMLSDLKRQPLPEAYRPPPYRWRVAYARAWTVQTDVAGSASAEHKTFIAEAYRLAEASSASIKVDHPFAQDRDPEQAYFVNLSDAEAEAQRRLVLFKASRAIYRMTLPRRALQLNLGDTIEVTHERFDLSQGRMMTLVEMRESVDLSGDGFDGVEVAAYG